MRPGNSARTIGDKNEMLPTAHGFDEFYGNLYHLNAEEEPELPDYPKVNDPEFPNLRKNFGPRGVLHSFANPDGTQKIEDTGPLTKKRMETIDDDIAARSVELLVKQVKANKPVFLWVNFTHCVSPPIPSRKASGRPGAGWASMWIR
jgi:arylsulfatase A-like enzyme